MPLLEGEHMQVGEWGDDTWDLGHIHVLGEVRVNEGGQAMCVRGRGQGARGWAGG